MIKDNLERAKKMEVLEDFIWKTTYSKILTATLKHIKIFIIGI